MRYKALGKTGLRVSELCLGTMSFGDRWGIGADEATSHKVLDAFVAAGGNFLDTANFYHGGQTESFIGTWLKSQRDRIVLATKFGLSMDASDPNAAGNHRKNLVLSVEASLRRLQTDYIDLMWIHVNDSLTPITETLRALDDLVRSGKVMTIGVSDTPAWLVSASQVTAELRGWNAFAGLQIEYSLLTRDAERDLLPMARHFGMSLLPWAPLAAGVLTGKYTRGDVSFDNVDSLRKGGNERSGRTSDRAFAIARVVDEVADELGCSSAQVALAWVKAQGAGVIPIVGARRVSQVEDSLGCTNVTLSEQQQARLDEVSAIDLGFPHEFLASDHVRKVSRGAEVVERIEESPWNKPGW